MLLTGRKLAGHSENGLVPVRWNSNRATHFLTKMLMGCSGRHLLPPVLWLCGVSFRGPWLSGRAPSDSSIQEGTSIPTFWSASAVRATDPMHPCDFWVIPSIMAVAIDGCLSVTISRQSGQLAPLAASRILRADPNPTPPRVSGKDALETTLDPTPLIWRISQRHVHTSLS